MHIKLSILILFFFLPLNIQAQSDALNKTDANGRKTGYWKVYYDNGNIRYEGLFKNDQPVGELKRYYEGGVLQASMIFSNDGKVSYATLFFENKKLAAEGKYTQRQKDSTWSYYSGVDGHLTMKENYSMGKRNGESVKYYRNHQISETVNYQNDMRNGTWKQYFENGALRLESAYLNDKREGVFHTWNSDGKPSVKGNYKEDVMHGEWVYYNENGEVEIIAEYNDGILLPNPEIERRQEEFSRRIEESIGKYSEPEILQSR